MVSFSAFPVFDDLVSTFDLPGKYLGIYLGIFVLLSWYVTGILLTSKWPSRASRPLGLLLTNWVRRRLTCNKRDARWNWNFEWLEVNVHWMAKCILLDEGRYNNNHVHVLPASMVVVLFVWFALIVASTPIDSNLPVAPANM